jgi:hypothetical protein
MVRVAVAVIAAGVLAGGCATIARGTGEQIAFDTIPSGAEVRVVLESREAPPPEGAEAVRTPPATMACVTPCVLQVKRHDKMMVTVSKPGFENEAFSLAPQVSGEGVATSVAGNLLLAGGVIGVIVDGASGAGLEKCPNPVRITLRPLAQAQRRGGPPPAPTGFGYDPVAACKEITDARNAQARRDAQTRSDAPM